MLIIDGEATRDPIFLLQRRQVVVNEAPPGWVWADEGFDFEVDPNLEPDDSDYPAPEDYPEAYFYENDEPKPDLSFEGAQIHGGENCTEYWSTERVFLTREEATAWGEARSYNYPIGWRVYCHCAEGELTKVLNGVRATK